MARRCSHDRAARASSCGRRSSLRTSARSVASTSARKPSCGCSSASPPSTACTRLDQLTPALLDDFLASRPRSRPRSFNHLLGVVGCLLDWAVSQQLLDVSPLRARRRRVTASRIPFLFDPAQARQLLEAAGCACRTTRGRRNEDRPIGRSSRSATGSGCAPVRRADCASAMSTSTARSPRRARRQVRQEPPGPARTADRRAARRAARASPPPTGRSTAQAPLFSFDGRRCVHPGTASQTFHQLVRTLELPVPDGVSPPTAAQPPSHLRGRVPAALVSRGA